MLYRLILGLLWPVLVLSRLWRGERRADLSERLAMAQGAGPVIWLHGASNGEITSARWLVEDLRQARPDLDILVTCNTVTARRMVRDWQMAGVTAALAPLDTGFAVRAFLRRWRPLALLSLEGEVWPTRLAACAAAGVPVVMLGARLSERSHRFWRRFGGVSALAQVAYASAQDGASRQRLVDLGLPVSAFGPEVDLKAEAAARGDRTAPLPRAERAGWVLAASTHPGEEEAIVAAFVASGASHLILAPRHPSRGPDIAAMLARRGIAFQRRSQGAEAGGARVLLADTMGEMDRWYARCGICIIGGTFADKGGHTPWEPARHGCALVHGASLHNFAAPFAALDGAGGAVLVTQATLGAEMARLDGAAQDRLAARAATVLQASGDATVLFHAILTLLRQ